MFGDILRRSAQQFRDYEAVVWPAEVENALFDHPAVLEAAVIGVPDDKWGETVRAVVVLRDGHGASESDLIEWCRSKVGSVKKPTSILFRAESLQKSGVGKGPPP